MGLIGVSLRKQYIDGLLYLTSSCRYKLVISCLSLSSGLLYSARNTFVAELHTVRALLS
jgi:hypothetical protein